MKKTKKTNSDEQLETMVLTRKDVAPKPPPKLECHHTLASKQHMAKEGQRPPHKSYLGGVGYLSR